MVSALDMSLDDIIKLSTQFKKFTQNIGGYSGRKKIYRPRNKSVRYKRHSKGHNYKGGYSGDKDGHYRRYQDVDMKDNSDQNLYSYYDEEEGYYTSVRGYDKKSFAKITISNIGHTVSKEDIEELFSEFGDIVRVKMQYDAFGRFVGMADVLYTNKPSALNAQKRYNGIALDGRPMQITLTEGEKRNDFRGRRHYGSNKPGGFHRGGKAGKHFY